MVDGSLLGDANGVEPGTGRQKESGKWQRPRFTRKALMRCCLVKWIITSTGPKEQGEMEKWWKGQGGNEGLERPADEECLHI